MRVPWKRMRPHSVNGSGGGKLHTKSRPYMGIICISCCILCALLGGSINVFSLYGPVFIRDLHLEQYQVNTISTMAMMFVYILIPLWGRICQITSPRLLSFISGILFGASYLVIASTFRSHSTSSLDPSRSPFLILLLSYACIGAATSSALMSSIIACTKTLEYSPYQGLLTAAPIACFGLSGIVESQVAVQFFSFSNKEIDLASFSAFLATVLFSAGMLGTWGLRTPDEVSDMRGHLHCFEEGQTASYGSIDLLQSEDDTSRSDYKTCSSTALLLRDPVLCWLTVANLLLMGPTEVYNLILGSLLQSITGTESVASEVSQHVALLAIVSTVARLSAGILSDHLQSKPSSTAGEQHDRFMYSPFVLFLVPALVDVMGFLVLGTVIPRFPNAIYLTSASIGLSYASGLSLLPVTLSIWGTGQFPVAWGIISLAPAAGIGAFGYLYSVTFQHAMEAGDGVVGRCVGSLCYTPWATICALGVVSSIFCVLIAGRYWAAK